MDTQTTKANKGTGRNRGARKGSDTPPVTSIGSHMTGKDQTPAVKTIPQVREGEPSKKPDKALVGKAAAIIHGFRGESDKLKSIKDKLDEQRGGLSTIVFRIVTLGWNGAPKPAEAFLFCKSLLNSAETLERSSFQKAQKLAELPSAREALGASWQTYKSQILRCVERGLDPNQFASGTVYREAANKIGNQVATRAARQTAGRAAAAETASGTDVSPLRTELQASLVEFIDGMKALDESAQLTFANKLHELTKAAAMLATEATETPEGERATGVM